MGKIISLGNQDFEAIRKMGAFYIDKTGFIKEWWENKDIVTLITRPRRFGKTLNLSMTECFFSNQYSEKSFLFEGLSIWKDKKYHNLQGKYPVIFISFAGIKANNYKMARQGIIYVIMGLYAKYQFILQSELLNSKEKTYFSFVKNNMSDAEISISLYNLSLCISLYYGKKVIILLDEYDTPMQEAYVYGYWDEMVMLVRTLFNYTFKTNPYLERGLLTGITRVSKESAFSDLNNLEVVTTTSKKYCTSFGFTEEEVFKTLEARGLASEKEEIKKWYDGFIFGYVTDIYNPWSITKFLDLEEYGTYWADTSSNKLISKLIMTGTPKIKMQMEDLLAGKCIETDLEEQIVFEQLGNTEGAVWSLLVASGYIKPMSKCLNHESGKFHYQLKVTNYETSLMFRNMVSGWFPEYLTSYNGFKEALLAGDIDYMNQFMNEVSEVMFSSFDSGSKPSAKTHPERFYHGFVLGLIVDLSGKYYIRSNRESGFGRYDVMIEPKNNSGDAIIIEFKVFNPRKDNNLEDTVKSALKQIEERDYDAELISHGITKDRIRHYGFAFKGKEVLIN
ncbi:MAG: AAA family ATPase [Lachnospiraceae bacterium]|nr:AAA family ATPase [Lachnospiraceae bacterium]